MSGRRWSPLPVPVPVEDSGTLTAFRHHLVLDLFLEGNAIVIMAHKCVSTGVRARDG